MRRSPLTTKITIISGFLGAGKTTFLKKIIPSLGGKIVLIENEFGNIGIDGDLMDKELPIKEINSSCICCSGIVDFKIAIDELTTQFRPDHLMIEPSGVGSLSDIIKVCRKVCEKAPNAISLNHLITIVDVSAFDDYSENFGGFYLDQIKHAQIIFLSHFESIDHQEAEKVISRIREYNHSAYILEEEWFSYEGDKLVDILNTIESCEIESNQKTSLLPANKLFSTVSFAHPRIFSESEIDGMFISLKDQENGNILRAKGIIELDTNQLISFQFTPHHYQWDYLKEAKETKIAVIGSQLNQEKITELFLG